MNADRRHVPVTGRVARLRQGDQYCRLGGVHVCDGKDHPALDQVVVNHLRIEDKTVTEASPKVAEAHLAQELALAGLDGDLGVERHH